MAEYLTSKTAAVQLLNALGMSSEHVTEVKLILQPNEIAKIQLTKAIPNEEFQGYLKILDETYYLVKKE